MVVLEIKILKLKTQTFEIYLSVILCFPLYHKIARTQTDLSTKESDMTAVILELFEQNFMII